MSVHPERGEVERFRQAIAQRLGLEFEDAKLGYLGDLLLRRARETHSRSVAGYLSNFDSALKASTELRLLAEELTVGETYFFRNSDNLRAFAEVVIPDCLAHDPSRRLRILSAGCSSGEEAFSLAIVLLEQVPELRAEQVTLLGIDINPAMVNKARSGVYSGWSLRETPAHVKSRYFKQQGDRIVLDPDVRARVSFEERNLVEDDTSFFYPGAFDVVFCRNVTIYFSAATTQRVIARLARALTPGGYLFLGHSETLRGISSDFRLRHTHETFYYQLRQGSESLPVGPRSEATVRERPILPTRDEGSWVDAIGRAADRIARLADPPPTANGSAPASAARVATASMNGASTPRRDLDVILALLKEERFADALALIAHLPAEAKNDADAQLLRAVALTHAGQLPEAEQVCRDLLLFDELNAGAHYVMALCREHAGDGTGAAQHDETAVYLAPTFAMPHLHLGLLAKRASDHETARRELGMAVGLLAREDGARILLFGGGFTREALTKLCEAELRAFGGQR